MSILVIAEQRDGKLNRATWETIAAAQTVRTASASPKIKIAVLGSGVNGVTSEVAAADSEEVLLLDDPALATDTADGYVMALARSSDQEQPSPVFLPHTYQTRDFAPALAARLGRALVTDVTEIRRHDDSLLYTRPVFQGKM